jgi:uncharacterized protein (TIGR02996 family)
MSDESALLAAILAHPDEDTPRLMYADWLQENGQPERAEFIRSQIERTQAGVTEERRQALLKRETAILNRYRLMWLRPFQTLLHTTDCQFRRGFVEHVEADGGFYLRAAADLYRLAPVRSVVVRESLDNLLSLNRSERPRGVRLRGRLGGYTRFHPTNMIDLLPQAPPFVEPWITHGEWLVLAWAVWSAPDRQTATRLAVSMATREWRLSVGIRPFDTDEEFASWCVPLGQMTSPRWLRFRDGQLVAMHDGTDPPDEFQGSFWE